jgi:hypothetical protein
MSREGRRRWSFNERFLIGADNPAGPMLERWRLIQTPLFGIYIHFIYREDLDRVPHDHPWRFWSLVLHGGYIEERHPDIEKNGPAHPDRSYRSYKAGARHSFPLADAHRIMHVAPGTITLCLVGRKQRRWGFWVPDPTRPHRSRWVDYEQYINSDGPGMRVVK